MDTSETFDGQHTFLSEKVLKAFYAVFNELGDGFMEKVYRKAMLFALRQSGLRAEEEVALPVHFRGVEVGVYYADIVVEGLILLELKAAEKITRQHSAQLGHYLRSTRIEVGYVLLFGEAPRFERIILTNDRKRNLTQV